MQPNNDKHRLRPLVLITVITLAVYAAFLFSDFQHGQMRDTYQVTVEQEYDALSPVDGASVNDNTSADSDTVIDRNMPDADNDTPENKILHAADVPEGSYIGNKNSEKYHRFDCEYGVKVHDNNLVVFDTLEDAINSGYKPCGACHPDE